MKNKTSYVISALLTAALLTSCNGGGAVSAGISDIASAQSAEESSSTAAFSAPKIELDITEYTSNRTVEIPIFKGDENDTVAAEFNKKISDVLKASTRQERQVPKMRLTFILTPSRAVITYRLYA